MYQVSLDLQWIGKTWRQGPRTCELEMRLMEHGSPSVSLSLFQETLSRLEMEPTMVRGEDTFTTDFICGPIRVTVDPYLLEVIGVCKESVHVHDLSMEGTSMVLRCALTYEHPDRETRWTEKKADSEYVTRREKHRSRFVHQNVVAIDMTRVKTTDWKGTCSRDGYEIEVEILQEFQCENDTDPILSLIWRMLHYGLGVNRPEDVRFEEKIY
jgi:hypothetical protein